MASGANQPPERPGYFGRAKKTCKKGSSSRQNVETESEDVEVPVLDFPDVVSTYEHPLLCTSRETHVTHNLRSVSAVHQWKTRCAHASAQNWWKQLLRMTDDSFRMVREMISNTPFGPLIDMDWGRNDASLGFTLVERWWDTTHTFHFPWGEAGITPLDFTMLTGMGVGEGAILPFDVSLESLDVAELYFPSDEVPNHMRLHGSDFSSGGIRSSWFTDRYVKFLKEQLSNYALEDEEAVYEHVCAFLFYYVGQCFFKSAGSSIRLGWLRCVLDIDLMHTYDWGGAILAHLYLGLDLAVRPGSSQGSVTGFVVILPYWWYEYFNTMTPSRDDQDHDIIPRIRGWAKDHRRRQFSSVNHNAGLARQQIEIRGEEGMNWQPWYDAKVWNRRATDFPARTTRACYRSRDLSGRRLMLMGASGWHAWYLGVRCWRQLYGEVRIPFPPPPDMQGNTVRLPTLLRLRETNDWPQARLFVMAEGDYNEHWTRISIGRLIREDVYRSVNIDVVTSHALRRGVRIGGGDDGPSVPQTQDWGCNVYTSQGELTYLTLPQMPDDAVSDLTQQFEELDPSAMRGTLLDQARQIYGYRQAMLGQSRQSFEYLQEQQRRYAKLQSEVEADAQDTQGLDEIQLHSQSTRRRTRGRRSSSERPSGSDL